MEWRVVFQVIKKVMNVECMTKTNDLLYDKNEK